MHLQLIGELDPSFLLAASDPARPWTWTFVGITFAIYLYIGWRSRVRDSKGFYVAGQGVPAIANGAATAAVHHTPHRPTAASTVQGRRP